MPRDMAAIPETREKQVDVLFGLEPQLGEG